MHTFMFSFNLVLFTSNTFASRVENSCWMKNIQVSYKENMYFYSSHHPQVLQKYVRKVLCRKFGVACRANKTEESIISAGYLAFLLIKSVCVHKWITERERARASTQVHGGWW